MEHNSTTPLRNTTSQHHFTTPLHNTTPQHHFTTPLHNTTSQHHFTTPLYNTTLQHHSTTPLHSTGTHYHHKKPYTTSYNTAIVASTMKPHGSSSSWPTRGWRSRRWEAVTAVTVRKTRSTWWWWQPTCKPTPSWTSLMSSMPIPSCRCSPGLCGSLEIF